MATPAPATPLQVRRRRVRAIRRRVVGGAVALFIAATGGVLIQLATGHDPALVRAARADAATSGSGSSSSDSTSSAGSTSSSDGSSSSGQATAVTTSAS